MHVRVIQAHNDVRVNTTGIVNHLKFNLERDKNVTLNLDFLNSLNLAHDTLTKRRVKNFPATNLIQITEEEYLNRRDLDGETARQLIKENKKKAKQTSPT